MVALIVGGLLAGLVMGYVLQRGQMCFHSAFRGLIEHRTATFKAWLLGVGVTAVGLALLDTFGPWAMSTSLPLRPVHNIAGGLVAGAGMAIAASCVSGQFYKLGAGMLGAAVGLSGWAAGELVAGNLMLGGPRYLAGRETLPTLLGLPRLAVAAVVLVVVVAALSRARRTRPPQSWRWGWPVAGVGLGVAAVWSWVTAGASGTGFGAGTVGAVFGIATGRPNWWLIAFLVALVPGATVAAKVSGGFWLRGETRVRYLQLAGGGFLLGGGGMWAGGCNLGHALSGMAQLNLSSLLVVASMISGIALARVVQRRVAPHGPPQDPAYRLLLQD